MKPDDRVTLRVRLDATTKEQIVEIGHRRGMTQGVLVSRLVSWFASQEPTIQSAIVGGMSADVVGQLVKRWITQDTSPKKSPN